MTDTASIYKGDTGGPWNVGVPKDDGSLETITAPWTCKIKVAGTAIDRAVSDRTADNLRFVAALTPVETLTLDPGVYVVAVEIENAAVSPPFRREHHIVLTVEKHIVGSSDEPTADSAYFATLALPALQEMRVALWSALGAAIDGSRIREVWRDGRRVVRENMSAKELREMLAFVDREIAEATAVAGGGSARRPISLPVWTN